MHQLIAKFRHWDNHDEINFQFMGNKTGHTNVCVFSNVFVCNRGALGTNPREREIAEEKKRKIQVFCAAQTLDLFCSISQTYRTGNKASWPLTLVFRQVSLEHFPSVS